MEVSSEASEFLHLTNNFLAYVLPALVSPFNVILVKTYVESTPRELQDAAQNELQCVELRIRHQEQRILEGVPLSHGGEDRHRGQNGLPSRC